MNVGERIKQRREELGLSQGDLAKRMGVSRQAISKAEKHGGDITQKKIEKFADALHISADFLLYGETKFIVGAPMTSEELNDEMMKRVEKYDQMIEIMEKFEHLSDDRKELVIRMIDSWSKK